MRRENANATATTTVRLQFMVAIIAAAMIPLKPVAALQTPAATHWTALSRDRVLGILAERIERGGAVGIVAGVLEQERPRIMSAGRRAGGDSPPVDATTVFDIGSVSKVFTTTLLAEMVVRGEVALDDAVGKYLPDSVRMPSYDGREITLLDLATVTSGLPRIPDNMAPADMANPYADYTVRELYAFLSTYTLPREPGTTYEYSNLGMGLLGHVLALRAGTSYEALVRDRILTPLGMSDTRIELTPALRERLAAGHSADLEPVPNWDFAVLAGAGAWRSTPNDMLRFLAAAVSPPNSALGQALTMAMTPRRGTGSPGLRIGLGWHVLERNGRRIVWHNGQTSGYHAFIGLDPETGANAVVLSNTSTSSDDIGFHLIDPTMPVQHPAQPRATVDVAAEVLERYVGRYQLAPEFIIEVTRDGDALYVQATNQPRFRVFAATPTRFFVRAVEAEIEFTTDEAGRVTGLVLHQGGSATPARRLP